MNQVLKEFPVVTIFGVQITANWLALLVPLLFMANVLWADPPPQAAVPTLAKAIAATSDLWGELALQQVDGPSYEFFEPLLPPPRYVHADFRYYPLVLSAPSPALS